MQTYPPGTRRIYVKFRVRNANQSAGALTNPTTVKFTYTDPSNTETEVTYPTSIVRPATGIYYLDFAALLPGVWRYRMDGDGSVVEGQFYITNSVFVP